MNSFIYELLVCLCEAIILGSFYLNLLHSKYKIRCFILLWIEVVIIAIILAPYVIVRIIAIAAFEFFCICFVFEDTFLHKLRLFAFGETISIVSTFISYLLYSQLTAKLMPFFSIGRDEDCTYTLLYLTIFSILISISFQLLKKVRSIELPWVIGTQIVIGIGECFGILAVADTGMGSINVKVSILIISSVLCLVLANLSIGMLASYLIKRFSQAQSIDFGKEISNMEYRYYEMSVENDKKIQTIRHDISNQIQTVYSLLVSGERQKGIALMDELKKQYGSVEQLVYCENRVINIILSNKKSEAEKQGIEVQMKVKDLPKDIPVSDFDVSTVICNMVDNAIRGCICSNQSHPRLVVEILVKNQYLVIRVLNSCLVNMNIESTDRIETTKSNSQTHGFGMPIIAGIVKGYKGDFIVSAQNGLFTATAVLSVK